MQNVIRKEAINLIGKFVDKNKTSELWELFDNAAKSKNINTNATGYESGNHMMNSWLEKNKNLYSQAKIDGKKYIIEVFNEKFKDNIVEFWIPIVRGAEG